MIVKIPIIHGSRHFIKISPIWTRSWVCIRGRESIDNLTNLSRADQWHEHPHRGSMLERRRKWDTGMTTRRERNEVDPWLIIYFCGKHVDDTLGSHRSRGNTAIVFILIVPHARYAWNTLKRFVSDIYIEKSELNSPRHTLIHLKCMAFKLNFPIFG